MLPKKYLKSYLGIYMNKLHILIAIDCPKCHNKTLRIIPLQKTITCSVCNARIKLIKKIPYKILAKSCGLKELREKYIKYSKVYNVGIVCKI